MLKKVLIVIAVVGAVVGAGLGIMIASATNVRRLREAASLTPNGKAERTRTKDALDYSVATNISAPPQRVWSVLTDAPAYPRWNTTVVKIDGAITQDSKINLVAKVAPDRTFGLRVSEFEPNKHMVWEDGGKSFMGVRTFTLTPTATGGTAFAMSETFSGAMLSMIEGSLPDFTQDFEGFTADLKTAAESQTHPP